MKAKNFGQMVIIFGVFLIFIMFVFSEWSVEMDVLSNIRYAELYCSRKALVGNYCEFDAIRVSLGQGLIFPLLLISFGAMVFLGIVSDRFLLRFFPFIEKSNVE